MERTDEQLARAAVTGDAEAFGLLVERLRAPLTGYIGGVLGSRSDDVEEVAQEAFLIAWENLPSLRNPARVSGWIYRIARNLATKRARVAQPVALTDDPPSCPEQHQPDHRLVRLVAAVARLSDLHRDVVLRKHFNGDSGEKIARELGIAPGTVWSRLSRAYEELREMLKESSH